MRCYMLALRSDSCVFGSLLLLTCDAFALARWQSCFVCLHFLIRGHVLLLNPLIELFVLAFLLYKVLDNAVLSLSAQNCFY